MGESYAQRAVGSKVGEILGYSRLPCERTASSQSRKRRTLGSRQAIDGDRDRAGREIPTFYLEP